MSRSRLLARGAAAAILVTCAATSGCAPRASVPANDSAPASSRPRDPLAVAARCERALGELDALIEENSANATFPRARLVEARSLRLAAFELYVAADYALALELVEDALTVLRNAL